MLLGWVCDDKGCAPSLLRQCVRRAGQLWGSWMRRTRHCRKRMQRTPVVQPEIPSSSRLLPLTAHDTASRPAKPTGMTVKELRPHQREAVNAVLRRSQARASDSARAGYADAGAPGDRLGQDPRRRAQRGGAAGGSGAGTRALAGPARADRDRLAQGQAQRADDRSLLPAGTRSVLPEHHGRGRTGDLGCGRWTK